MPLGRRLRLLRKARGVTQKEVSAATGVREALISELETGVKQDTTGNNLERLARYYGLTIDELLHDAGVLNTTTPLTCKDPGKSGM